MLYDEAMGGEVTDRKKAKKRHLTEGMTQETLTDLTVLELNKESGYNFILLLNLLLRLSHHCTTICRLLC